MMMGGTHTEMHTVEFDLSIKTEQCEEYYAAKTNPFAITVYGDSEEEAEERALQAVGLLLKKYSSTSNEMHDFLNHRGVKHILSIEERTGQQRPLVRECKHEMRLEVPAGA